MTRPVCLCGGITVRTCELYLFCFSHLLSLASLFLLFALEAAKLVYFNLVGFFFHPLGHISLRLLISVDRNFLCKLCLCFYCFVGYDRE